MKPKPVNRPEDHFYSPLLLDTTYDESQMLNIPPSGDPDGNLLLFNLEARPPGYFVFPHK